MKKIVSEPQSEIKIEGLTGKELVAYRCKSDNSAFAVLAKLETNKVPYQVRYGFIPLNSSSSAPRYVADGWLESIRIASERRQLFAFNNQESMLKAMLNKTF